MTNTRTICLDLDDTIVHTMYAYFLADAKCAAIIATALGEKTPTPQTILNENNQRDMLAIRGGNLATKNRYPNSWGKSYQVLAERYGVPLKVSVHDQVWNRANEAVTQSGQPAIDGAIETIKALREAGHILHIVTAGIEKIQMQKIKRYGLEHLVDTIHVTADEKLSTLRTIRDMSKYPVMMVGDSKRSDILPALTLRLDAVWVMGGLFSYGNIDLHEEGFPQGTYGEIASLKDLPKYLAMLDAEFA